jgi:hypothetical protein
MNPLSLDIDTMSRDILVSVLNAVPEEVVPPMGISA